MKHNLFILLIIFTLICFETSPVFAHSGDTDSNGGHYDHSTGQYHYHHGYPAHQHYDIDGDGDIDCPYLYSTLDYNNQNSVELPELPTIDTSWLDKTQNKYPSSTTNNKYNYSIDFDIGLFLLLIIPLLVVGYVLWHLLSDITFDLLSRIFPKIHEHKKLAGAILVFLAIIIFLFLGLLFGIF